MKINIIYIASIKAVKLFQSTHVYPFLGTQTQILERTKKVIFNGSRYKHASMSNAMDDSVLNEELGKESASSSS